MRSRLRPSARVLLLAVYLVALACGVRSLLADGDAPTVTHAVRLASTVVMIVSGGFGLVELARLHRRRRSSVETGLVTITALASIAAFCLHLDYADDQLVAVRIVTTVIVIICLLWLLSLASSAVKRQPRRHD